MGTPMIYVHAYENKIKDICSNLLIYFYVSLSLEVPMLTDCHKLLRDAKRTYSNTEDYLSRIIICKTNK